VKFNIPSYHQLQEHGLEAQEEAQRMTIVPTMTTFTNSRILLQYKDEKYMIALMDSMTCDDLSRINKKKQKKISIKTTRDGIYDRMFASTVEKNRLQAYARQSMNGIEYLSPFAAKPFRSDGEAQPTSNVAEAIFSSVKQVLASDNDHSYVDVFDHIIMYNDIILRDILPRENKEPQFSQHEMEDNPTPTASSQNTIANKMMIPSTTINVMSSAKEIPDITTLKPKQFQRIFQVTIWKFIPLPSTLSYAHSSSNGSEAFHRTMSIQHYQFLRDKPVYNTLTREEREELRLNFASWILSQSKENNSFNSFVRWMATTLLEIRAYYVHYRFKLPSHLPRQGLQPGKLQRLESTESRVHNNILLQSSDDHTDTYELLDKDGKVGSKSIDIHYYRNRGMVKKEPDSYPPIENVLSSDVSSKEK
jgi:hypothetical protein